MQERILIEANGARARCRPEAYLGERFWRYLAAVRAVGAQFDGAQKVHNLADLVQVPALVAALKTEGFDAAVDPVILERLGARATEITAAVARAQSAGLKLYDFQEEGVAWLSARDAAVLADEMGLGKTIQALMSIPAGAPVVVVAPAAAKGVWRNEAAKWRPDLACEVLAGRNSFRWPGPGQMVVLNYDILPQLPTAAPAGCVLIGDEAHAIKSPKAQRTKRWAALAAETRKAHGRVWLLTGTPLLNRPPELWNVLRGAGLERVVFGGWPSFVRHFRGRPQRFGGYEWGQPSAEVPGLLSRAILRRSRKQVLPSLPTKTWRTIEVEIDPATRAVCDEAEAALKVAGFDLANLDATMLSTIQGAGFEELSRARHALATAKMRALPALVDEYEEAEEPLVVFSAHRPPVDFLAVREGWEAITGDTPAERRTEIVEQMQAGKLKGVAATITAAGTGITLTRAAAAIFVDLAWTPALNAQAEDRLCRIGQERGVVITRLVADHAIDARVLELLVIKQDIIEASTEAITARPQDQAAVIKEAIQAASSTVAVAGVSPNDPPSNDPAPNPKPATANGSRRGPANAKEEWAAKGLARLAGDDHDGARDLNGCGFNRLDTEIGHSLAEQLVRGLTDRQWAIAMRICMRYPRQVGRP